MTALAANSEGFGGVEGVLGACLCACVLVLVGRAPLRLDSGLWDASEHTLLLAGGVVVDNDVMPASISSFLKDGR